ncbi:MAG: beta-ketoacyl-[acyl-carrier-protein] synthase family protein [Breznakibacter sp.]|nr:beta-ketoacyl-[acyl-carrier-protein] synthase family protein [Breznakibacter sp.]
MQIYVSGIGIVSAIGIGVEENFASLAASTDGLGDITLFETSHNLKVGEVKATNEELKARLHLPKNKTYSRSALLGMVAAQEAVKDAKIDTKTLRIGLISSTTVGGMDLTYHFYEAFAADNSKGRLREVAPHDCYDSTNEIAKLCDINGYTTTISTACSSAANAIMLGARLIRQGYLDCAVVGGTDALCKFTLNGFHSLMILDQAKCRPFDDTRTGLNLGEGAGYIVLQREDTLQRKAYCKVAGFANTNDAFHQTASSAEGIGPFKAMEQALKMSSLKPEEISYINVHGTGTNNNDSSEGSAIKALFNNNLPPISSTKPFTGHTLAAAGGVEAVFSVLAIDRGVIFPNLNFKIPMAELEIVPQTKFQTGVKIDTVMSNSFGFGGNCSSLIFSKI